jgi:hypothetical protein
MNDNSDTRTHPDAETRDLYNAVVLGFDVKAFTKSPVGLYLLSRADEERMDALVGLVDVSPDDAEAIRALQSTVKRADSFQYWLEDAIQSGHNAQAQLVNGTDQ